MLKRYTPFMTFIFTIFTLVVTMTKGIVMPKKTPNAIDDNFSPTPTTSKLSKNLIIALLVMVVGVGSVSGATKTATVTGNWNNTATWGGTLVPVANDVVIINTGITVTLDVSTANTLNSLTINSGATLNTTAAWNISATTITVNGYFKNGSTGTITGTMTVGANATYEHAINGGTIPPAAWNAASNCNITGITNNAPLGGNQTFGNFTWDCLTQNTWIHITSTTMSIQGNLTVNNSNPGTNGYDFSIEQDVTIAKDLIINITGIYRLCYQITRVLNVNGNVTINGGQLLMNSSGTNANGTLNVAGNFNFASGTINARAQTAASSASNIIFNGTGATQTYTSGGTITSTAYNNIINFTVNSGAYLQMGTGASPSIITAATNNGTNTFTLSSGATLGITSSAGITTTSGLTGNIQVAGTRNYAAGANYIYNATADQVTGNGLPTPLTGNLTFSGSGTKTYSTTATSTANVLTVNAGVTLLLNGNSPLTPVSATINGTVIGQSVGSDALVKGSGAITFASGSTFIHNQDGRKITTATWDLNSTCIVKGIIGNTPYGTDQTFGNFTWDCSAQSGDLEPNQIPTVINGTLTIANTNGKYFGFQTDITVGKDLNITGGIYRICSNANRILSIKGNVTIDGGKLLINSNSGTAFTGTVNVAGNFTNNTLGTLNSNLDLSYMIFNGTTPQTYTSNGTVTGPIHVTVNNGASVQLASSAKITGNLLVSAGGTLITINNLLTLSGNFTNNGAFTAGSSPVNFNGIATQNIDGFTTTGLVSMINTGGTANFMGNVNGGGLTLAGGTLNLGSGTHTFTTTFTGTSGTLSAGSSTLNINGGSSWTSAAWNPGTGTVNYGGAAQAVLGFTYNNLSLSGSGTKTVPGNTASNNLNITTGVIANLNTGNVTANSLTLGGAGKSAGTWGSTTSTATYKTDVFFAATGYVTVATAISTITTSLASLSGFNYAVGSGPSSEQSFNVIGFGLSANITVTPLSNFEISALSGGIFSTNPLTLTPVNGTVNANVYVRMKAGLTSKLYGPENITLTSTSTTTKTVACTGTVIPTITVGGGGSYCASENINLTSTVDASATNFYWEGPNNFYSQLAAPIINQPLTAANTGTYTITATYVDPTAPNLVINGDFETPTKLGNTLTQYQYVATSANALSIGGTNGSTGGEGNFAICNLPQNVHTAFSTNPPKSGSYQMVVNGSKVTTDIVWGQTINTSSNTTYQFSYWEQSAVAGTPSKLKLYANGIPAVSFYVAPAATNDWQQYIYTWYSGSSTNVDLTLRDAENSTGGNDFALDNIVFQLAYSSSASVDVSVITVSTAPTVTIVASANPVNTGTSVTFTATPTNGGTGPTYQWKVNTIPVIGSIGTTYTYVPANGNIVTCEMTSNSGCLITPALVSSSITMNVTPRTNFWKGSNSTVWSDISNWTGNKVPGSGDDVVFSTTSTLGDAVNNLVVDIDRIVGNLINQSTKQLIIPPARLLTVNGTITTKGASSPSSIYIQAFPDGTQQNGSLLFYNLPASPVYGTVEMYSKANYLSSRTTYKYTWQYFGIPINNITADPTFYNSYVRRWDESKPALTHWIQLGNTDVLNSFYGYEITQKVATGKLITFQGQLVNWDWTSPILAKTTAAPFPGQYIFANPYTAAIDIVKFIKTNALNYIDQDIYLYSTGSYSDWVAGGSGIPALGLLSAGQYQSATKVTGIALPTQIPSMQAFLVQVAPGSQPLSVVNFKYSDVVKNNELQRVKGAIDAPSSNMVHTMIEVTGTQSNDRMWIFSDTTFTRNYDRGWDGRKKFGNALAPQLYAIESDGNYQINCVNDMNNTILGFKRGIDLEYTFTFTHVNTESRYAAVYLQDSIGNKIIDITASGSKYQFAVDSVGTYQNRFKIITRNYEQNAPEGNSKIKIFNSNEKFYIQNQSEENGEFSLFDMAGRQLNRTKFGPTSITEVCTVSHQGIYVAKAVINSDKVSKRVIVR